MNKKLLVSEEGLPAEALAEAGQTLVEILVALAIAVIVIVALVTAVISSMRNAQFAKLQAQTTKLSQEALEIARTERDQKGWENFKSQFNGLKCLKADRTWASGNCSQDDKIDGLFLREVTFTDAQGEEKKIVLVSTSWIDSSGTHKSELSTYLTKWQ